MEGKIELGDRVKDKITGLIGIVIGKTDWLYGCSRLTVQPEDAKDGRQPETCCVDEPQLSLIKKSVVERPTSATAKSANDRPHGPRQDATRGSAPARL